MAWAALTEKFYREERNYSLRRVGGMEAAQLDACFFAPSCGFRMRVSYAGFT